MTPGETPLDSVLRALQERAKELSCLYRVDEALARRDAPLEEVFAEVVAALPPGWQFPAVCQARLTFRGRTFAPSGAGESAWVQRAPIVVQGDVVGSLAVQYSEPMPPADEGPFLKEERRLIEAVAGRIAQCVLHRELAALFERKTSPAPQSDWQVLLDLLHHTDRDLFRRLTWKMLNRLSVAGIAPAKALLSAAVSGPEPEDENRPRPRVAPPDLEAVAGEAFRLAALHLGEAELLGSLQVWIREDRIHFLLHALESQATTLVDIANVIERYHHTEVDSKDLSAATQVGLKVALVRRLLSDHPAAVSLGRRFVEIEDFFELLAHTAVLPKSHGRLGGKASGLFLAAQVLRRAAGSELLKDVRTPRTWYLPSDGVIQFISFNNLDDIYNWRYRDLAQIRAEYPHLLDVFKASRFPPEIVNALSTALDDLGDRPLIVRSSSLLEDRAGSAFSGKYKSLFLANQGDKRSRLLALLDAVAEVYASVFAPDPIEYRAERGLLEHHEEMGVMIQEVVGVRAGRYFLPAFSGVALSQNELRWSPRIRREDGLLRLVPGLGTRAVDRLVDDYPILVAPGQPGLRVNASPEEVLRYSPRQADVIDLEANAFATVPVRRLLREAGDALPGIASLVSVYEHDRIRRPSGRGLALEGGEVLFTFEGLIADTAFMARMRALLAVLREALGTPVDLEFASDGSALYLLQCRAQTYAPDAAPAALPRDVPPDRVLFIARRYVSNGLLTLTHVVYVDPDAYTTLDGDAEMRQVARAVGRVNRLLPRRQFALMGPGRWGSRGDIHLGVPVTYGDVHNAALLVEIARGRGSYAPDLSFGTHFFQDLVEADIRYLPLYPGEAGTAFDEAFLRAAPNLLVELCPDLGGLASVLHVVEVARATGGRVLRVAMNAEQEEAIGWFAAP